MELVSGGKEVATVETRVNVVGETDLFVGFLGQRIGAWNLLTTLDLPGDSRRAVVSPILPDSFPHRTEGLEAFDVIVLGDSDVLGLSAPMLDTLEGWVAGGGTLVLSGGPQAAGNMSGLPEQLRPVEITGSVELENTSALERLGQEPLPCDISSPGERYAGRIGTCSGARGGNTSGCSEPIRSGQGALPGLRSGGTAPGRLGGSAPDVEGFVVPGFATFSHPHRPGPAS